MSIKKRLNKYFQVTTVALKIHNKDLSQPDTSKESPEPMVSVHANLPEFDLSQLPEKISISLGRLSIIPSLFYFQDFFYSKKASSW